jgi:hypothetical protein
MASPREGGRFDAGNALTRFNNSSSKIFARSGVYPAENKSIDDRITPCVEKPGLAF